MNVFRILIQKFKNSKNFGFLGFLNFWIYEFLNFCIFEFFILSDFRVLQWFSRYWIIFVYFKDFRDMGLFSSFFKYFRFLNYLLENQSYSRKSFNTRKSFKISEFITILKIYSNRSKWLKFSKIIQWLENPSDTRKAFK